MSRAAVNEPSEYEKNIMLRIQENMAKMRSLFPDGPSLEANLGIANPRPKRASRTKRESTPQTPTRRNPKRKARQDRDDELWDEEDIEDEDQDENNNDRLIVKLWPGLRTKQTPKSRRKPTVPRSPVEITEDDLVLVATTTIEKNYDSVNGTTCHQCRQKTDDLKTTCKSKDCFGVRGQFCGPCLRNRYGEDAKVAIMDDKWICPPCRGECNCSFCMNRKGRRATGIMIHIAKEKGYNSVKDYLAAERC